jgi:hypothetical protein
LALVQGDLCRKYLRVCRDGVFQRGNAPYGAKRVATADTFKQLFTDNLPDWDFDGAHNFKPGASTQMAAFKLFQRRCSK